MIFYRCINFTLILFISFIFLFKANAGTVISIKGEDKTIASVVFSGFNSDNPILNSDAKKVVNQINYNLQTTGLFKVAIRQKLSNYNNIKFNDDTQLNISPDSLSDSINMMPINIDVMPNFQQLQRLGVDSLIVAEPSFDNKGFLQIRIRMWDTLDEKQVMGKLYSTYRDNYKKMANTISNEIFKSITGEKSGHFNSKILYVSETGPANKRSKRINVIDFDGSNRTILTDGKDLVLTPIFSKKLNQIFYLRYFDSRPQVFSLNLDDMTSKKVGGFKGTTFASAVHPSDPNLLALSVIIDSNSDIYELNILENVARKLTRHPAIDTTPSYSPDAKMVAFSSDRENGQQIYIMDNNLGKVERISFNGGSYSKPVWSPDGKMIAFTKIKNNKFHIGIMLANGKNERILTSGYIVEGAKWSPNGRYLIYSKKASPYGFESIPKLYIIDVVTGFEYQIPTTANEGATDPDWQ